GRGEQGLDAATLISVWIDTLRKGAIAIGRTLPSQMEAVFPFYGDTLDKFTRDFDVPLASDIHQKGGSVQDEFLAFQAQLVEELRQQAGVTDAQVDAEYGTNPKPKGPLNWEWVQALLRSLDKHGGGMSQK